MQQAAHAGLLEETVCVIGREGGICGNLEPD